MYSLLSNCNKNKSFIIIHILCTPDIDETIVEMFKSLVIKFPYNIEIILKIFDIPKPHIIGFFVHFLLILIE